MAAPLVARRRVIAVKHETTVGTAISLAAANATFNATNVVFQPAIEFQTREGQGGGMSQLAGTLATYEGVATFTTEFYGGATDPAWLATLFPACGMIESSANVYSPSSLPPEAAGAATKTVTLGCYVGGVLKQISGAMGNAVFRCMAGRRVMIDWTFRGIWDAPTDVAILAPTYETTAPLRFASAGLSIGGVDPVLAEMTLDLGNELYMRESAQTASGLHSCVIVGRRPVGQIQAESQLVAAWDTHGIWKAGTLAAFDATMGTSGNQIAFAAPKFQITNVQEQNRGGVTFDAIDFQLVRSVAAGEDELTVTTA
jgi:hypothetical protein